MTSSPFSDSIRYDEPPLADAIADLQDHPHFRIAGCRLTLEVSACGLVYCGDCAAQIGSVSRELAGLHLGPRGTADRWLHHDAVAAAWYDRETGADKQRDVRRVLVPLPTKTVLPTPLKGLV